MSKLMDTMRCAAVAAVLLAGSCAGFSNEDAPSSDGAVNHPISVEPHYNAIKLPFSAPDAGLLPDDAARFDEFVADYLEHGNGSISVSAPTGPESSAAIGYFAERLASLGVPRSRILVGTHDPAGGDTGVEIGYLGYVAHADPCGDWSKDLAATGSNQTAPNFGCAVQHNIAAMVSDPRDLVQPRPLADGDAARRATVLGNYEKGKVTSAEKTTDQSVKVSDVGGNQ
ncbi:MAG: CpaD family pilus assembly protein [Alphaproteobacteria bacterium]|nr:CpaD family pilus assembly protein [Alphaproteobacteria bacterium]